MRRSILFLALVLFLIGDSPAAGLIKPSSSTTQENKSGKSSSANSAAINADQKPAVRLESKLVSLTVTVSDSLGRSVSGLKKEDFEVFDDGVKQEIAHFGDEDAPITMGFVYDVSGSMRNLTTQAFQELRKFFEASHSDDEYFIIAFNTNPHLVQDFTSSPGEITNRVIFVKAKGMTALYDAVYLGIEKARQGRHQKRALLIISDGGENNSRYSQKELRNLLKESDVPVYSIAMGSRQFGNPVLEDLSGLSGGRIFFTENDPQSLDTYTQIALSLRHQYVIGFYPKDASANVEWHKVRINANAPPGLGRLSLSYRKSYRSFK